MHLHMFIWCKFTWDIKQIHVLGKCLSCGKKKKSLWCYVCFAKKMFMISCLFCKWHTYIQSKTDRKVMSWTIMKYTGRRLRVLDSVWVFCFIWQSPGKGPLFEEKGEEAVSRLIEMNSNELSTRRVAFCGL